ncbi:MAG TPA: hypothetical protein VFH11_09170 [Gemmatimonadota bacterium]|nr:hypothetical protein [Gemmatimonadota bacterium]
MRRTRTTTHIRTICLLLATVVAPACSTETTPQGPAEPEPLTSGSLELRIQETGPRPDTDGYAVALTLATQGDLLLRPVPPSGGTVHVPDLPLGVHILRVEGLAAHCFIAGQHPRGFTIRPGATTEVVVEISCPGPGAVLVKTVTRGRDVGAAYTVLIEGESSSERSIGANDSLLIGEQDLPPGTEWFVRLTGIPDNCWQDRPPQRVPGLRGTTIRIEYAVACIPRGSRIAFERGGRHILLTDGSGEVLLSNPNISPNQGPSLSPDRSRVVFSTIGADLGGNDLFLVHADGSGGHWVTLDGLGYFVGSQAWSPDGSRIVFWNQSGSTSDIYIVNADGSRVRLTFGGWNTHPAWSPDGRSIAFCRTEGDIFENWPAIYRMSAVDGSGITKLAEPGCDPAWSPDGSKIAFTHLLSFWPDLAVIGADGSGLTTLHGAPTPGQSSRSPSWSPDGSQIAYAGGQSSNRIWIVGFEGGAFGEPFPFRFGSAPSWR